MGLAGLGKTVRDVLGSLLGYVPNDRTSINWSFPLHMHSVLDWKAPVLFQFSFSSCDKHHDQKEVKGNLLHFPFISTLLSITREPKVRTHTAQKAGTIEKRCHLFFSATFLSQSRLMCPRVAIPEVAWVLYINSQLRKLIYTLSMSFWCPILAITKSQSSNLIYKEKNGVAKFLINE